MNVAQEEELRIKDYTSTFVLGNSMYANKCVSLLLIIFSREHLLEEPRSGFFSFFGRRDIWRVRSAQGWAGMLSRAAAIAAALVYQTCILTKTHLNSLECVWRQAHALRCLGLQLQSAALCGKNKKDFSIKTAARSRFVEGTTNTSA